MNQPDYFFSPSRAFDIEVFHNQADNWNSIGKVMFECNTHIDDITDWREYGKNLTSRDSTDDDNTGECAKLIYAWIRNSFGVSDEKANDLLTAIFSTCGTREYILTSDDGQSTYKLVITTKICYALF